MKTLMKSDILELICDPATRDALDVVTEPDARGRLREFLVNPKTGRRFPIRDGIPIFLQENDVSGSNRRYQALYDRMARFYDFSTWLYSRWKGMSVEARLREYLDELEVADGNRVLEISVGTGRNLRFLPSGAEFHGLDISWGMLKQCRRNAAKWKLNLNLFMGAAERLPFKDEAFDVVFHFGGINFFNDKEAAIREMIRVAKPGTKFVIGDENEALAKRYEKLPVTGGFYGQRKETISAPVDLLPPGMREIRVKDIAGGDLYCLSFRKPR
jgi:ubiquinone/menaquinone biosynthesis C-methylase UbiE